jgi:hypothetical protein
MSLIPPTPIVLSKMKYLIQERYGESASQSVLTRLGPFPIFKLYAEFRDVNSGVVIEFDDIGEIIDQDIVEWDCIDKSLNMMTRLRIKLKENTMKAGFLRVIVKYKFPDKEWGDLFLDEFPINLKGLRETHEPVSPNEAL